MGGEEADPREGAPREHGRSSRDSLSGAGWHCREPGTFLDLVPPERRSFSWLSPSAIWRARNDLIARYVEDPTDGLRRRWLERIRRERADARSDLILDGYSGHDSFSFAVVGDPGEGDASQYAVVPPLLAEARDSLFWAIAGDVIYPAGDVNDYPGKFCRPYEGYPGPIFAVPGNHDWYDNLNGFMVNFCGAAPYHPLRLREGGGPLLRLLWREPEAANPRSLERCRTLRSARPSPEQSGPYFVIETGPLRIVGVDAGIRERLDRDQGEWLRRVSSESPKPKVLISGEPIYSNGEYDPPEIEGGGDIDEVIRDPRNNYVAVISGDKHNYQRYPVELPDGRTIQHVVSGGGGAFMHATHKIPKVDLPGVSEEDFVCYPRRGDSLSFYSRLYDRRLGFGRGWLYIPPEEAARIMAERLGIEPAREGDRHTRVSEHSRRAARGVLPLPGSGPLHPIFSEFFDWNEPPLFKNFLKIDVTPGKLRITCFGVTGCLEHEQDPPVEDLVEVEIGQGRVS